MSSIIGLSPNILFLSGKQSSGKDTSAAILNRLLSPHYNIYTVAFADLVKTRVCEGLHLSTSTYDNLKRSSFQSTTDPSMMLSGRDIVVAVGMAMRDTDDMVFINRIRQFIKSIRTDPTTQDSIIIVTDLRFQNELEFALSFGRSVVIHVDRTDQIEYNHQSEQLDLSDTSHYILDNNGAVDDLISNIEQMLADINLPLKPLGAKIVYN